MGNAARVSHQGIFISHPLYYSMKTERAELVRSFNQDKQINATVKTEMALKMRIYGTVSRNSLPQGCEFLQKTDLLEDSDRISHLCISSSYTSV